MKAPLVLAFSRNLFHCVSLWVSLFILWLELLDLLISVCVQSKHGNVCTYYPLSNICTRSSSYKWSKSEIDLALWFSSGIPGQAAEAMKENIKALLQGDSYPHTVVSLKLGANRHITSCDAPFWYIGIQLETCMKKAKVLEQINLPRVQHWWMNGGLFFFQTQTAQVKHRV